MTESPWNISKRDNKPFSAPDGAAKRRPNLVRERSARNGETSQAPPRRRTGTNYLNNYSVFVFMTEKIVEKGYDEIAKRYHEWRQKFDNSEQFNEFSKCLPKKAKVLDLGCGAGIPVAKFLIEKGYDVTGVDISLGMIKLAKKNVPKAKFIKISMTEMDFKENYFDGLIAVYSIIHVPKEKQKDLFLEIKKILKPEGITLISLGNKNGESREEFLGTSMFWSHHSAGTYLKMMKNMGFEIIFDKTIETAGEKHYWILARNKK